MAPERTNARTHSSPDHDGEMELRGVMLRSSPVFIIPRKIPGGVAAVLDAVFPDDLPRVLFEGSASDVRAGLKREITARPTQPRWLANWLIDDIVDKANVMAQLTSAPAFRVKLEVIDDDHCREFHVDDVTRRLVTTYRGPGTEWIPPRIASTLQPGSVPPDDAIRHLSRGHVALMRGGRGATLDRPGVLHRSPTIAGTGTVRLFLTIDELGRRLH